MDECDHTAVLSLMPFAIFLPSSACDESSISVAQWYDLMFVRLWGTGHACYLYHAVSEGKPVLSIPWSSKLMNKWWLLCFWGLLKSCLRSKKILGFCTFTVMLCPRPDPSSGVHAAAAGARLQWGACQDLPRRPPSRPGHRATGPQQPSGQAVALKATSPFCPWLVASFCCAVSHTVNNLS